jgi:hypothetical protein
LEQHRSQQARISDVLSLQQDPPGVEYLPQGYRLVPHVGHQEVLEIQLRIGTLPLAHSNVALPTGVDHLIGGNHGGGDQSRQGECTSSHPHPVASDKLSGPVPEGVGPCLHRLVILMPFEIIGQCGDGGVPLGGILLERLGDNVVEVALVQTFQPLCRGSPGGRQS